MQQVMHMKNILLLVSISLMSLLAGAATAHAGPLYAIEFRVSNSASYGAVQFKVNYASAPGDMAGADHDAWCTANSSLNALGSFWNDRPGSLLNVGLIKTPQMSFPAVVATCQFESTGSAPVSGNFTITVTDWQSDTTGTAPTVVISSITAL